MQAPEAPRVRCPVMLHHWRWLTFLHWRYPADVVQARLPEGLTVETFDGTAWVGLVPFLMDRVRAPRLPALPWLSRFPETNVRTYVRGPDGRTGIWFLSLDADRLPPVLAARTTYGLPYFWSSMSARRAGDQVIYRARRRWPGPTGARCDARVEFGEALAGPELTTLDHFLTARYRLYSTLAGRLIAADAEHPPWPLRRVAVRELRQDLVQAAGLPAPDHDPVLHASDGVEVRIGLWRPV
jgi:uncharacterized protein YqjF (DUF2071 family)